MVYFQITQLGDSALTVSFGNIISAELNDLTLAADAAINAARLPGFIETVPAYSSVSVFYDPVRVRSGELTARLEALLTGGPKIISRDERAAIEIPVSFSAADAPDLALLAEAGNLSVKEVIDIFTAKTYRVFMLGFLPGFSYMGEVDERIAMPRKPAPRAAVPRGSVGIAGRQTGIYSMQSPGGWQIIGRTEMEMFLPDQMPPSRLRPGDRVRFVKI